MEPGTWTYYLMYDFVYLVNMILTIVLKYYAIRALYLFIVKKRWPKQWL